MPDVALHLEVEPDRLRRRLDPSGLRFETTAEVAPLRGTIGQPRALDALDFGLGIRTAGYNLFVVGAPGSGRLGTIRSYLERVAGERPVPRDWVYVNNFSEPDRPLAIGLPAGMGRQLARDIDGFVQAARREIVRAFESEHYEKRQAEVLAEVGHRQQELQRELEAFAAERGFGLQITPLGMALVPLRSGLPLSPDEVEQLPAEEREGLKHRSAEIMEHLQVEMRRLRQLEREGAELVVKLNQSVALAAIGPLLHSLRDRYSGETDVLDHVTRLEEDIPDHLPDFLKSRMLDGDEATSERRSPEREPREDRLLRYRVNVVVDNGGMSAAPVVIEANPAYYNLVGRVEYRVHQGVMVTDPSQIRAGALHRANGGFLVLEAVDVLSNPFSWQVLKRALRSREVTIENLGEQFSPIPTATLRPQPIPLDVKVVLIGSPLLYVLLQNADPDIRELFKVKVDFAPEMEWNEEHIGEYAAFISSCVKRDDLKDFDRSAVARIVEHGARLREDQRKLSTRLLDIADLASEASFWAEKAGHVVVFAEDVDRAVEKKEYRSNLLEERTQELIRDNTLVIETEGARVGQVNGLSVIELGDHSFGRPSRITARVALGRGTVESIEREIELSGPIHSKGFLILSGYLAQKYAQERPLALRATITFEQSYDEVEGDSASSSELYALLSALSGLPVKQGIAVTGSINQHGEVQAVGGTTRKVEGFFQTCRARGLTGEQGVIIPAANVPNLMLSDEVVEAVRQGKFHVWAVRTVDEGIELLTGAPAGHRKDGAYPVGCVHQLVGDRLRGYAEHMQEFAASPNGRPATASHARRPVRDQRPVKR